MWSEHNPHVVLPSTIFLHFGSHKVWVHPKVHKHHSSTVANQQVEWTVRSAPFATTPAYRLIAVFTTSLNNYLPRGHGDTQPEKGSSVAHPAGRNFQRCFKGRNFVCHLFTFFSRRSSPWHCAATLLVVVGTGERVLVWPAPTCHSFGAIRIVLRCLVRELRCGQSVTLGGDATNTHVLSWICTNFIWVIRFRSLRSSVDLGFLFYSENGSYTLRHLIN